MSIVSIADLCFQGMLISAVRLMDCFKILWMATF